VQQVAQLLRAPREDAWAALWALLEANTLLEKVGPFSEPRKFSASESYALRCLPESVYCVRASALRQLDELEAAAAQKAAASAPAEPAAPPIPTVDDSDLDQVREFIDARCVLDSEASVSEVLLRARYVAFEEDRQQEPIDVEAFRAALARAGHSASRGKYSGLRLLLLRELEAQNGDSAPGPAAARGAACHLPPIHLHVPAR
jgi:hypothetical protein